MATHFARYLASIVNCVAILSAIACENEEKPVYDASGMDGTSGSADGAVVSMDAGADTPTGDASAVDAFSPDAAPLGRSFYLSPSGSDANQGTMGMPRKTMSAAFREAKFGDTIWLLDGIWDATVDPMVFPSTDCTGMTVPRLGTGVTLRAVNPLQATINGGGRALCANSANIRDIAFNRGAVEVREGETLIENVTLAGPIGCNAGAGIQTFGNARVTLINLPGAGVLADNAVCVVGTARDQSEIRVVGGTYNPVAVSGTSGAAPFVAADTAKISLDGVTVNGMGGGQVVVTMAGPGSTLTVKDSMLLNTRGSPIAIRGQNVAVTLLNTTIRGSTSHAIIMVPGYLGSAKIVAVDTVIESNGANGIFGVATLDFKRTRLVNNASAGAAINGTDGSIIMEDSEVSGNNGTGLNVYGTNCKVRIRNTKISNNGGTGGIDIGCGGSAAEWDLGKMGSPGGNTLTPARANTSSLYSRPGALTVYAVGNTWTPSLQGADMMGRYLANGAGAKIDVTTGSGSNYVVLSGTLRLAENM